MEIATLGAGCFWCIEACFKDLKGVLDVIPGYMGGNEETANYTDVCSGKTNHAEVTRILYDSDVITFDKLLEVFWCIHDPTQLNRQGNDVGSQYRSVIFYHNIEQKKMAELKEKTGFAITGEDTPFYFWKKEAAKRILEDLPDVKIIAIFRNPI